MTAIHIPQSQHSLRSRVEQITPEVATEWLEKNLDNRPIRQSHVDALARDMANGNWMLTGEAIRFDVNGSLIDGQHRLWAVMQSGATIDSFVMRGLDPDAKFLIDTGVKRTLGDAFAIGKETHSALLAGIVNICWKYDVDRYVRNNNPTHADAVAWLAENEGVRQACLIAGTVRAATKVAPSPVGAAYYLNSRADAEAAETFWQRAAEGIELKKDDPILAWRRWSTSMLSRRDRPTSRIQFAFHMKAMNLWREGRSIRILHWKTDDGIPLSWVEARPPSRRKTT